MAKKTVRILHIGITETEARIVEKIEERSHLAEIIRALIREYGEKKFKEERLYAINKKQELEIRKKQIEIKNTPPEEVMRRNFNMKVKDGVVYSLIYRGLYTIKLSDLDVTKIKLSDRFVTMHQEILDGFKTMQNIERDGQIQLTKAELENLKKQWDQIEE